MLADLLWAVYGLTRSYPGVVVGLFVVGVVLAAVGLLRLLARPLELEPIDCDCEDCWWERVPREHQAKFERLATDIDFALWEDQLRWRETKEQP